ncbi:MAG: T9SS type A sorting domain-containing protein [Bacteroidales bacterium]|nr:T9SS type A sorting domain-containing protein [Bacteroidales bacterium]
MEKILVWFFSFIFSYVSFSQGIIRGMWRDHFPYFNLKHIEVSPFGVWAASDHALFLLDKKTEEIQRFSRINGLHEALVTAIAWDSLYQLLVIGYQNGNIDFLYPDGKIYNIPDIKISHAIGSKKINRILPRGSLAYLSTDFGIVVLNLAKKEIKETYILSNDGSNNPVYDIHITSDSIFAVTQKGVFAASLQSPNLSYFNYWRTVLSQPPSNEKYSFIEPSRDYLLIVLSKKDTQPDVILKYRNGVLDTFYIQSVGLKKITNIRLSRGKLIFCHPNNITVYDDQLQYIDQIYVYNTTQGFASYPTPRDAQYASDGFMYIADETQGLVKNWQIWTNYFFKPESPYLATCFSLNMCGTTLTVTGGGFDESFNNFYSQPFIASFAEEKWFNLHPSIDTNLIGFFDPTTVYADPKDPKHLWIGFYNQGLMEYRAGEIVKVWNSYNSTLPGAEGTDLVRITGITVDQNNNLWIVHPWSNKMLSVLTSKNELITFNLPPSFKANGAKKIAIDAYNNKWIPLPRNEGIIVFNENGTLNNFSDDKFIKLNTSPNTGNLPSLSVNAIVADKENQIWIGTDKGIAIIDNPANIFSDQSINARQILVEVGGYVQPLLGSENVTCIAVDGGNRKWVGTEKAGVFLLSPDGTIEIAHYTTDNSPLPSNTIMDIVIQPLSGEVFIATSAGLVSYGGEASEPFNTYDSIMIYPNPVPSDFQGLLTISNLVSESTVTITDVYGNLIYQTTSQGGMAVWNCKDIKGNRPATGIYLILIANSDGTLRKTAKFLFYH